MFRLLITLLIVVTLPGASICCCAVSSPDPSQSSASCCRGVVHSAADQPGDPEKAPDDRCPCTRQHDARIFSAELRLSQGSVALRSFIVAADISPYSSALASLCRSRQASFASGCSASSADGGALLILLCINRC